MMTDILISVLSGVIGGMFGSAIVLFIGTRREKEETEETEPVKPTIPPPAKRELTENEEYIKAMADKLHGK